MSIARVPPRRSGARQWACQCSARRRLSCRCSAVHARGRHTPSDSDPVPTHPVDMRVLRTDAQGSAQRVHAPRSLQTYLPVLSVQWNNRLVLIAPSLSTAPRRTQAHTIHLLLFLLRRCPSRIIIASVCQCVSNSNITTSGGPEPVSRRVVSQAYCICSATGTLRASPLIPIPMADGR